MSASPESKTLERKIRRVPGNEITTNVSLVSTWSKTRVDPNGYYEVLGLRRDRAYSMGDIQKAYRRLARRYHPDGSAPDPKMWTRIQVSYDVLSNPALRADYDKLDSTERWVDHRVIELVREKLGKAKVDLNEIVKDKLNPDKTVWERKREYDSPCYYYDTEEAPDADYALTTVELVCDAAMRVGHAGEPLKVGLTDADSYIAERTWGSVLMVGKILTDGLVRRYFEGDESH